jgi:hypothetical protein
MKIFNFFDIIDIKGILPYNPKLIPSLTMLPSTVCLLIFSSAAIRLNAMLEMFISRNGFIVLTLGLAGRGVKDQ